MPVEDDAPHRHGRTLTTPDRPDAAEDVARARAAARNAVTGARPGARPGDHPDDGRPDGDRPDDDRLGPPRRRESRGVWNTFVRRWGWRAYALPILIVITVAALVQGTARRASSGGSPAPPRRPARSAARRPRRRPPARPPCSSRTSGVRA